MLSRLPRGTRQVATSLVMILLVVAAFKGVVGELSLLLFIAAPIAGLVVDRALRTPEDKPVPINTGRVLGFIVIAVLICLAVAALFFISYIGYPRLPTAN